MKKLLFFFSIILLSSCAVTKERYFNEDPYLLKGKVTMIDKSHCCLSYNVTLQDTIGLLYLEGNNVKIRYLYHMLNPGDTLTNGEKQIINK